MPQGIALAPEQEAAISWEVLEPDGEVRRERVEQVDGAVDAAGLLELQLAVRDGLLDEDGLVADVAALEREHLAGADAGVGQHAHHRCAAQIAGAQHGRADALDGVR